MHSKQNKRLKKSPAFKSEAQERRFWEKHDSVHYIDWKKAALNPAFPALKPSAEYKTGK